MTFRLFAFIPALALLTAPVLTPREALATGAAVTPFERLPAAGTGPSGAEFLGTLDVQRFVAEDGQLVAVGTLAGQVTRIIGSTAVPLETVDEMPISVPVVETLATCERLELDLGPIRLGQEGLLVSVNRIHVDAAELVAVDRVPEALLCPVAEALAISPTSPAAAEQLATLLPAF